MDKTNNNLTWENLEVLLSPDYVSYLEEENLKDTFMENLKEFAITIDGTKTKGLSQVDLMVMMQVIASMNFLSVFAGFMKDDKKREASLVREAYSGLLQHYKNIVDGIEIPSE